MHTIANGIRLVILLIDPLYTRGVFSWQAGAVWHTVTLPLGLMATLSLTLFWHETMSRKLSNNSTAFLKKLKIPFIVVSLLILGLDLTASVLRALFLPFDLISTIEVATFIVIMLTITIFFFCYWL